MKSMYRTAAAVKHVAIFGAGTIGASWVTYFLAKGLEVTAIDPSDDVRDGLRRAVAMNWRGMEAAGLVTAEASPDQLTILSEPHDLRGRQIDFVQENVRELLALKQETLRVIDENLPPDVIVASSTSGLSPSKIQERCRHRERILVGHPMNPPHLIPLVEIVGGSDTATGAIDAAVEFYRLVGKRPVVLHREILGHLATRLAAALWREAAYLVDSGVATVEDVDAAVTDGLGLRLAVAGPHMSYHLGGGAAGLSGFFDWARGPLHEWCESLGSVTLDAKLEAKLVLGVSDAAKGQSVAKLTKARDAALAGILKVLHADEPSPRPLLKIEKDDG